MGWHVVWSFEGVVVIRFVFLYDMIQDALHVTAHVGVGVFVNGQGARSVLHEEVEQSSLGQGRGS